MQEFIARANIANFSKQLLECRGDVERTRVLTSLLRAEEEHLAKMLSGKG